MDYLEAVEDGEGLDDAFVYEKGDTIYISSLIKSAIDNYMDEKFEMDINESYGIQGSIDSKSLNEIFIERLHENSEIDEILSKSKVVKK